MHRSLQSQNPTQTTHPTQPMMIHSIQNRTTHLAWASSYARTLQTTLPGRLSSRSSRKQNPSMRLQSTPPLTPNRKTLRRAQWSKMMKMTMRER